MLVCRAAAAVTKSAPLASLVSQAVIADGLASEFPGDTLMARDATLAA